MAKAADFNGDANETDVIPPEKCRGKGRPSILSEKAYLWLLTINNPQDLGISLDQQDILERLKDDIAAGKIVYIIARMEQSLTADENGKHMFIVLSLDLALAAQLLLSVYTLTTHIKL